MATSGVANFNPDLLTMYQEAADRCGVDFRTGYDYTSMQRSFNLLMVELSNHQLNLWTYDQESLPLVSGTTSYSLPADTIDVLDGTIRINAGNTFTQSDLVISRTSFSDYMAIPNKLATGQPTQFSIQRLTAGPVIYFYTTPDGSQPYVFFYNRLRRIQDAGSSPNYTADTPTRFIDAVIAGLAFRFASKKRECFDIVPRLKAEYAEAIALAQDEDRDRSSLLICPYITQSF